MPTQFMQTNNDGRWSSPEDAHKTISGYYGSELYYSYDGLYLFFLNSRIDMIKVYWVDAGIIESYR